MKSPFRLFVILTFTIIVLIASISLTLQPISDTSIQTSSPPHAVPTFHSIGIYWSPPGGSSSNEAKVQYRPRGKSRSKNALSLWYDKRDNEYRGSIVHLTPGITYEIKLSLSQTDTTETIVATTWSEDFPIGKTIYLPKTSSNPLVIGQSGTPTAYTLYTFHPKVGNATIDVRHEHAVNIEIIDSASYIIIRGLKLKGANKHSIWLNSVSHDVVIEENDISDWGQTSDTYAKTLQAGIYSRADVERIIVQRNKIHDPNSRSHSWDLGHPRGPQAVAFFNSKGNHVLRYNEVYNGIDYNGDVQVYNDIFGAGKNSSFEGFPNRDTDIYGNYLAHAFDDAIETEGANMNVRVWGNFLEHNFIHLANAPTSKGPLYIWRNIGAASRRSGNEDGKRKTSDEYGRGHFIKSGGKTSKFNGGRTYIFHNTTLQPPRKDQTYPLGTKKGIRSSGGKTYEHVTRNNVFVHYRGGKILHDRTGDNCTNDFDYDLFNGELDVRCSFRPHEQHGKKFSGTDQSLYINPNEIIPFAFNPVTGTSNGKGYYPLDPNSPAGSLGIDAGEIIPNFNDNYLGTAPDMGAFERGSQPMEFGVNAYSTSTRTHSPSPVSQKKFYEGTDHGVVIRVEP